jgi:predicted acyltransferase
LHTLRRAALIFLLGLFLNGFPSYNLATFRIPGVLQRIAVCYFVAAVIYLYTNWRAQVAIAVGLLALYWMLMTLVPVPGFGPGVLEKQGNLEQYIDSMFLTGHMYGRTKIYDPEGLLSTIPAIATALFGILTGYLLRSKLALADKTAWMMSEGAVMLFAGKVMNLWFPINKNLWSSSFVVFMAGLALLIFGIFFWLIDGQGWRKGIQPFIVYGSNAIAAYVLSGLLPRLLRLITFLEPDGSRISLGALIYRSVCEPLASPMNASLLYALANVLFCYLVVWFMYRRKWFVKL